MQGVTSIKTRPSTRGLRRIAFAVALAVILAIGGSVILAGSKATVSIFGTQTAYASELRAASTWSDAFNKKVDALPAANKMTLAQAKTTVKLAKQLWRHLGINSTADISSMTEQQIAELKAVGSKRIEKLSAGISKVEKLEKQAEANRIKAFKKYQVKGVKVVAKKGAAVISWAKNKNATEGYEVYMSSKKDKGFKKVDFTFSASSVKVTVYDVDKGKQYYFKVRAKTRNKYTEKLAYSKFSKAVRSAKIK